MTNDVSDLPALIRQLRLVGTLDSSIIGMCKSAADALELLSRRSTDGEAVAQMVGPWDMEDDSVLWLEGCERLVAGDPLYTHPAPIEPVAVTDEMVERAREALQEADGFTAFGWRATLTGMRAALTAALTGASS